MPLNLCAKITLKNGQRYCSEIKIRNIYFQLQPATMMTFGIPPPKIKYNTELL